MMIRKEKGCPAWKNSRVLKHQLGISVSRWAFLYLKAAVSPAMPASRENLETYVQNDAADCMSPASNGEVRMGLSSHMILDSFQTLVLKAEQQPESVSSEWLPRSRHSPGSLCVCKGMPKITGQDSASHSKENMKQGGSQDTASLDVTQRERGGDNFCSSQRFYPILTESITPKFYPVHANILEYVFF